MNSKLWIQKALTMCSLLSLVATYSLVTLANSGKPVGELIVTGASKTSYVTVNGEAVKGGRTIFSASTISTPEGAGAIVNLDKVGRIELAPNSTFALSFDDKAMSGNLTSGSLTVLSAARSVDVKTLSGEIIRLNAGETVTANSRRAQQKDDDDDDNGAAWWVFALITGGAIAAILYAARSDNDANFGGGATTVSPTR